MQQPTESMPGALYARVSSGRQDVDLSVAAQLRALRHYAERNGYVVAREYIDEAESGCIADLLADDSLIAVPTTVDGQPVQPADSHLTADWGHFGANQAVMPGQGNVDRRGGGVDVYLNNRDYWRDVPIEVWEYRLGAYQVLKNWLSCRGSKVLGRGWEWER